LGKLVAAGFDKGTLTITTDCGSQPNPCVLGKILLALVPVGALEPKLKSLGLNATQINDAGCAALASALDSGALPALESLFLVDIPASDEARATVRRAGLFVF